MRASMILLGFALAALCSACDANAQTVEVLEVTPGQSNGAFVFVATVPDDVNDPNNPELGAMVNPVSVCFYDDGPTEAVEDDTEFGCQDQFGAAGTGLINVFTGTSAQVSLCIRPCDPIAETGTGGLGISRIAAFRQELEPGSYRVRARTVDAQGQSTPSTNVQVFALAAPPPPPPVDPPPFPPRMLEVFIVVQVGGVEVSRERIAQAELND